ncbi:glycoside hydrolase family 32 protein [Lederbergia panacisoli]|uniref:glycoside hydrolase family 32 protein n=1 Tax=Lederbergia panacisoli TaxID=1255251 RepID=UPI00214AF2FF|nr:glycoside hydrolase family 32 protein [Lederbergia panacisoli]MCR2823036.1 glycoside hydrolase family 32 protein [Lederbergia panacisoli]
MKKIYSIIGLCILIIGVSLSILFINTAKSKSYYTEDYRPQYHFTPEENWMNDPNGMVYYKGEYHLFYQHNPHDNKWGPMYWGHAVSKDMISWEHFPIALEPDDLGTIFSGSAVVDWNDTSGFFDGDEGLVAIFTHNGDGQKQSIAYSKDKGRTWKTYEGNPVIPSDPEIKDFRDPKVFWHEKTNKWVMVLAAGKKIMFYGSPNLIDWEYLSEFGNEGALGGVWECPDLFELPVDGDPNNTKWVLEVDIGDGAIAGGSGAQYFIGEFDGTTFVNDSDPKNVNWLDYGADFYAAQSFSDIPESDNRRIMIAWMSNWLYANQVPTENWRGGASFPRVMELKTTIDNQIKLFQRPIDEIQSIVGEEILKIENKVISSSDASNLLSEIEADLYLLNVEIELDKPADFGFKIRKSSENDGETTLGYTHSKNELFVKRIQAKVDYFSPYFNGRHFVDIGEASTIKLNVLVDKSSIEVFAQDGEFVITDLIFPSDNDRGLEFFIEGNEVLIRHLEIHELKTTWR